MWSVRVGPFFLFHLQFSHALGAEASYLDKKRSLIDTFGSKKKQRQQRSAVASAGGIEDQATINSLHAALQDSAMIQAVEVCVLVHGALQIFACVLVAAACAYGSGNECKSSRLSVYFFF